jgi:hypothetical protein
VVQARWVPDKPPVRETPRRRSRDEEEDDEEDVRSRVRPGKRSSDRYDDEDEDDDRPRARKRSREDDYDDDEDDRPRKRARARDEDEDDEDDRPRRRGRARAEEDDDEDDRPRRRRGRDDEDEDDYDDRKSRKRRGKKRARGLGLVKVASLIGFIAGCIIAGACVPQVIFYIMLTIAAAGGGMNLGSAAEIFMKITEILVLAYAVTAIASYSLSLAVPNRRGSIGFAISALVVGVAYAVLYFIFQFLPVFGATGGWGSFMGPGGGPGGGGGGSLFGAWFLMVTIQLLFAAPFILSIFWLRQLALSVKDRGFAAQCLTVVFLAAGYAGERLLTYIMLYVFVKNPSKGLLWVNIILLWIGFFVFVLMTIPYIQLYFRGQALDED